MQGGVVGGSRQSSEEARSSRKGCRLIILGRIVTSLRGGVGMEIRFDRKSSTDCEQIAFSQS